MSNLEVTRDRLKQELMFDHDYDDEGNVIAELKIRTEEEVSQLIEKYKDLIDQGIRLGSFVYYVVNQIERAENNL